MHFITDEECTCLDVILFGKPSELSGTEDLLRSIKKVKNVSAFEKYLLAREYFEQYNADMIILDADNDTAGWQYITEKFRKINQQVKIVLISSNTDDAVKAYEYGVFDYLLKPVKKKQLERILAKSAIQNQSDVRSI